MADRIKGITVEIGGNTTGLKKALKDVNNTSRDLQSELRDVQKLLRFDPNNVELIAQRQKLLNDTIENTSKKLDTLKEAEKQVQKQFEQGDIGAEQYRAFQRELQDTAQSLQHTQNQLADLNGEQEKIQSSTKTLNNLFDATGTSLEDYADVLGDKVVRAIQQGTASSKDIEKAFERVAQEAIGTSGDVGEIREALNKLDSGEASVRDVKKELGRMSDAAKEAKEDIKNIGGELGGLAAGIGAGVGLAGIFEAAMNTAQLDTQIDLSFNVSEESKASVKDVIKTIEAYGIDAETALEGTRIQWNLNADASDEANAAIVKGAAAIVSSYGEVDFAELMQETNELASTLGISQEEALGMTNALLDMGFPADEIDIIAEYGNQLMMAGYSAEEVQAVFAAGIDTKSWNIDVLLDGVKEGRILIAEMGTGVDEATAKMIEGTSISAEELKNWGAAVAEGGDAGTTAMNAVAKELAGIEDASKRNEIGTRLFGTLWEEQGQKITDTLINANTENVNFAENQEVLNEKVNQLDSSAPVAMKQALSDMMVALEPLLLGIADFVGAIAEWIQKNPELTATITAVVIGVGILIGIVMAIIPVIHSLAAAAVLLNIGMLPLIGIILGIIVVIGLLIAAGVWLYKNWDEVMAKCKELVATVKRKFNEFTTTIGNKLEEAREKVAEIWGNIMDFFADIDLKQTGKDILQGLIDGLWSMATDVWNAAKDIASGIGDKVASILQLGSPSKLLMSMGEDTGEGLEIGLENTLNKIRTMADKMAKNAIPNLDMEFEDANITANGAAKVGSGKELVVNIHSPKALDTREANALWNRQMKKMALQW
jgi:phage-related minor tail protein